MASATDGGPGPFVLLVAAVLLLGAFGLVERRQPEPVLRFALLRLPGVRVANLTLLLNAGGTASALFFVTLYLQIVLGWSALAVGAAFAPVTLLILVLSPRAAALTGRVGVRTLLAVGLGLVAAGMLLLARVPVDGGVLDVLPALLVVALGSGLSYAPTFVAASAGVPAADQGGAAGLITSTQELGTAACLALLAFIATTVTGPRLDAESLTSGYRAGLLAAAGLLAIAVAVALSTPRPLGRPAEAPTPAP